MRISVEVLIRAAPYLTLLVPFVGCQHADLPSRTRRTSPEIAPVRPAASSTPSAWSTCGDVGPLRCGAAPSTLSPDLICEQLRTCIIGRKPLYGAPFAKVSWCDEVELTVALPPGAPMQSASVVQMWGEDSDGGGVTATYLVMERNGQFCVADELLTPERLSGSLDDDFDIRWDAASSVLTTNTHRTFRLNLDAEELADGASNYNGEVWIRGSYQVRDRLFTVEKLQRTKQHEEADISPWEAVDPSNATDTTHVAPSQ